MNELDVGLNAMRRAHCGATRRAARAWALIEALAAKRVLLPVPHALNKVAEAVYFSSAYDACERYETIEDFKEALVEDLNAAFERADVDGKPHYVVKPFFQDKSDFLRELGLGYLHGTGAKELAGLNVEAMAVPAETAVSGLTPGEMEALVAHHRRAAVTLVNLLRHCETALHYVRKGLTNEYNTAPSYAEAVKDEGIEALFEELFSTVSLPFEPPASTYFGTDADKANTLRSLPAGPGLDALLEEATTS